jgi:SAM-dependent methyltransferase
MSVAKDLKKLVKEKYGSIALRSKTGTGTSCCGSGGGCSTVDYTMIEQGYSNLSGYVPDADMGLGCGIPTEFARINPGDTVVDLGAGAGNDAFIARSIVGDTGAVIGIDMTPEMIDKARANAAKLNLDNVEFRLGEIEEIPVADETADVVVSNCVMNLVPDKSKAFSETFRILKQGGHFSISDIVLEGELPDKVRQSAELYAGCVSGAQQLEQYLETIRNAGFAHIVVQQKKAISIPDEILLSYLSEEELRDARSQGAGIYSVTVYADKPVTP